MKEILVTIKEEKVLYERAKEFFKTPQAIKRSVRLYRSGLRERYYVDFDLLVVDPNRCETIAKLYAKEIERIAKATPIDLLGFVEKSSGGTTGAIKLAGLLSVYTGIPNVVVRLGKELRFERVKIPELAP